MNYQLLANGGIQRSDGALVPVSPGNADYQAYMAWVAAGNTPSPVPALTAAQAALATYNTAISAGYTPPGQSYTFALDSLTIALFRDILVRNVAGDTSSITIYDTAGTAHTFVISSAGTKAGALAFLQYLDGLIQTAEAAGAIQ